MTPTESSPVFSLVTEVEPGLLFAVDDEMYELYTLDHLSPAQAATLRVLMRRENILTAQMEKEEKRSKLDEITRELNALRIELITMMSTLPAAVAEKLTVQQQKIVLDHIAQVADARMCPECQTRNDNDAKVCKECGHHLRGEIVDGEVKELPAGEAQTA